MRKTKEKRQHKKRFSISVEEIPITEEIMRYAKTHMDMVSPWIHGKPVKAYLEEDKRISITYEDHCWWFYRDSECGIVWE